MKTDELKKLIKSSFSPESEPFMIVATAGTTVFGSFDNINVISEISKKYGLWLHVDAAFGGSVIFSKSHNYLLKGIENADSISWNPHKMLRVPLQCSLLLVKDQTIPKNCNSVDVNYLFQEDKCYDIGLDSGSKYIQCGRKCDILKLWMVWKIRGEEGFENDIDKIYDIAKKFEEKVRKHPNFELVIENRECTNVGFRCINLKSKINELYVKIKKKMLHEGKLMISYQKLESFELDNFFRIVFINPSLTEDDLDEVLDTIARYVGEIIDEEK